MSARKFTAALFENVDYKAQAAEMAEKEEAKRKRKQEDVNDGEPSSMSGFFSRLLSRPNASSDDADPRTHLPATYPRVLLFGDSLTQYAFSYEGGWAAMLADKLQRRADVVSRGYSGYNTRWCRLILDQVFAGESPATIACVVILLGSNDASLPKLLFKTHVPLEEYEANLTAMIESMTKKFGIDKNKIILVTPPPVNRKMLEEERDKAQKAGDSTASQHVAFHNDSTSKYAAACRRVGDAANVTTLDLFSTMLRVDEVEMETDAEDKRDDSERNDKGEYRISDADTSKTWHSFFRDGIHFSRAGAEFLFSRLWPLVERRVEKLPVKYPRWRDVDEMDPVASLSNVDVIDDKGYDFD